MPVTTTIPEAVEDAQAAELERARAAAIAARDAAIDAEKNGAPAVPDAAPAVPNPDTGRLFDAPRVIPDTSDPNVLKVAFSGTVQLDRTNPVDVEFYNTLTAGHTAVLELEAHVAGARTVHRLDAEGYVDGVTSTKALVVQSIVNR